MLLVHCQRELFEVYAIGGRRLVLFRAQAVEHAP
jgi:hypothetical protein